MNDTLLVSINLSSNTEESTVEVITYLGQFRNVINIFRGEDAEIIYKTLINKHLIDQHLANLSNLVNKEEVDTKQLSLFPTEEPKNKETILFNTKEEAEDILSRMQQMLEANGYVSLLDYKDVCGKQGSFYEKFVGWTNLEGVTFGQDDDNYFYLNLPGIESEKEVQNITLKDKEDVDETVELDV